MRDGINRLAHVKKYSRFYSTICSTIARVGFVAGTGKIAGVDPREMGVSDLVVIWGTNPVNTQVNVMTHAMRARKERGAKIAAVDVYNNDTMKQADIKIILRPGTDGAFACGVMHVLFREGFADRDYLARYTDCPAELEAHLADPQPRNGRRRSAACRSRRSRHSPARSAQTKRAFFRLGYGFTRSRNGAAQMHAALCIPAVTGAWQYEGGGAFFNNYAIWKFDESLIEGHDAIDRATRQLDQSKIGRILTGDAAALQGRPAGQGDADPEHQSDDGRAGAGAGAPGFCPRGPVRGGARAVHDRDRADGRRRAAGDDVHGARRSLLRRRPPAHFGRRQADRAARRMPLQSRGAARARPAPQGRPSRIRDVAARIDRRHAAEGAGMAASRRWRPICGAICSRISAPRIISTASRTPTANSTSRPTGRIFRSAMPA